jgi:hypothetical protein
VRQRLLTPGQRPEASDEVGLSDHEYEESTTNEQHPSQPDVTLEGTDDQEHGKLEKIDGE